MDAQRRDPATRLLVPGLLALIAIVTILALATAACALTSQAEPTPLPTATDVPPVTVVVVPGDGAAITPTPDPAFALLTATAAVPVVPTVQVNIQVQQEVPAVVPTVPTTAFVSQTTVQTAPVYTPLIVSIPANCAVRTDWQPYTVQAGDTLGALAIASNAALIDVAVGNCMATPDLIEVGQTVYLPRALVAYTPVATVAPGVTGPVIGFVMVEPALVESGAYLIAPGNITVRAQGVQNAQQVVFYMSPVGTNAAPVQIGADTNMADGALVVWQVSGAPFVSNVWAVAVDAAGAQDATDPILVANNG